MLALTEMGADGCGGRVEGEDEGEDSSVGVVPPDLDLLPLAMEGGLSGGICREDWDDLCKVGTVWREVGCSGNDRRVSSLS